MLGLLCRPIWNASQSPYIQYSRENSQEDALAFSPEVLDPQLEVLNSRGESLEDTKYNTSIAILPLGSSQIPSALLQDRDVFYVLILEPFSG